MSSINNKLEIDFKRAYKCTHYYRRYHKTQHNTICKQINSLNNGNNTHKLRS